MHQLTHSPILTNWLIHSLTYYYFYLCLQPLAASDYIQIAQYFHTVIIKDIPRLNLDTKSQARRFITLIDTLYDHKVRVSSLHIYLVHKLLIKITLRKLIKGRSVMWYAIAWIIFGWKNRWRYDFRWAPKIDGRSTNRSGLSMFDIFKKKKKI